VIYSSNKSQQDALSLKFILIKSFFIKINLRNGAFCLAFIVRMKLKHKKDALFFKLVTFIKA